MVCAGHGLGCIAVAHWCQVALDDVSKIKGALLVAPVALDRKDSPRQTKDFGPVPQRLLPFPSIVVASRYDPFCSIDRARELAHNWASRLVDIGAACHIHGESRYG